MNVLLIAFLLWPCGKSQGDEWSSVWTELERLHAADLDPAEAESLRAHLLEVAQARAGEVRAELLLGDLEFLAGRDSSRVAGRLARAEPGSFTTRERWFLAEQLPPGEVRAREVVAALMDPGPIQSWHVLLAWNCAADQIRNLQVPGTALAIAENLHARFHTDWSTGDLVFLQRILGDRDGTEQVITGAIAREEQAGRSTTGLWYQRGLVALSFGDERLARDYLGRALALGSDDANLVLSRLDLVEGDLASARRGFATSILKLPPADWAWRGWGATLLPAADAAPARKPAPSNTE